MNRVDTKCRVRVYEIDGMDHPHEHVVVVESHWSNSSRVVLVFGNGKGQRFTVESDDLLSAVRRARD